MHKKIVDSIKKLNKSTILISIAVSAIFITGVLISSKSNPNMLSFLRFIPGMSADVIAKKSVDYLNKSVLQKGQTATLISDSEESGIIKMKIKIAGKTYDSYASKDGKLLFPEGFTLSTTATATTQNTQPSAQQPNQNQTATQQAPSNTTAVAKVAKTSLEDFVVSSCPFGTQSQRAIGEAVKNIPLLAKDVKVRYIGSVASDGKTIIAMHGPEEAAENLRQICVREEQSVKFWSYVGCYIKNATGKTPGGMSLGDSPACQDSTGVDIAKLNSCVFDPSRGIAYAKVDFDRANKFGVQGSPTFVLNDQVISETPFGGRSADGIKNIVCDSSLTPSAFCSTKLNTEQAATSFTPTYAKSN